MYTQCSHCKAIFRVNMKELTAAQGLLRCGECDAIFDAMKSLSTTLPEERRFAQISPEPAKAPEHAAENPATPAQPEKKGFFRKKADKNPEPRKKTPKQGRSAHIFLSIGITALALLLLLQAGYSARNWLARQPLTSGVITHLCAILGCDLENRRDVYRIRSLSPMVYSHPNSPNVLAISVSIQNEAEFPQPYPLLEISFLNKRNEIVALRRFKPEEYLKDFHDELMPVNTPSELLLNITDPGPDAVRFQLRFM